MLLRRRNASSEHPAQPIKNRIDTQPAPIEANGPRCKSSERGSALGTLTAPAKSGACSTGAELAGSSGPGTGAEAGPTAVLRCVTPADEARIVCSPGDSGAARPAANSDIGVMPDRSTAGNSVLHSRQCACIPLLVAPQFGQVRL